MVMSMTEEDQVTMVLDDMLTGLYVSEETKDYIFEVLLHELRENASVDVIDEFIEHYEDYIEYSEDYDEECEA